MSSIRVFIYEDNDARRDSLAALLSLSSDLELAGSAPDCSTVMKDMEEACPDVVLMDINMPNVNGIEGLRQIRQTYPRIKVLMQTVYEDGERIFECIRAGASGYVLKRDPPQRLLQAIQEVHEGGAVMNAGIAQKVLAYFQPKQDAGLTERERVVLQSLAEGLSYKMIADKLGVSYHTVNSHVKNLYAKLHVDSLGEAIAYYYRTLS